MSPPAPSSASTILEREEGLNRGYFTHVAKLPTAPVPGATPRQMNVIAQTPVNTQTLIDNSRSVRRATHSTMVSSFSAPTTLALRSKANVQSLLDKLHGCTMAEQDRFRLKMSTSSERSSKGTTTLSLITTSIPDCMIYILRSCTKIMDSIPILTKMLVADDHSSMTSQKIFTMYSQHKYIFNGTATNCHL